MPPVAAAFKTVSIQAQSDPALVPLAIQGAGAAGAYTLVNGGLVFKDAAGDEQWRLWGTDPDDANFNALNLYIGHEAGFSQPTDNASAGYYNIGIGGSTLRAITTGGENLAMGNFSALALSTGNYNTSFGTYTLRTLIAGDSNTAVGHSAMDAAEGADHNVALGTNTLLLMAQGDFNVALGSGAMSKLSGATDSDENVAVGRIAGTLFGVGGGDLVLCNQGVFIGASTRPNANASTNEVVIGYAAIGGGDNTVTIGNASATAVYLPPTIASSTAFSSVLKVTGAISPTQLVANTDNWNPTGLATANTIRIDVNGALNLTGIVAQGAGTLLVLFNTSAHVISLIHDATSTAVNRFFCPGAIDFPLTAKGSVWIRYDGTSQRWCVFI